MLTDTLDALATEVIVSEPTSRCPTWSWRSTRCARSTASASPCRSGQRRAIIGPNGAGKTTLFNAIAGAVAADRRAASRSTVTTSRRLPPHRRARLGISRTFQITNLFPRLSVRDNMVLALRGRSPRKFSLFGKPDVDAGEGPRIAAALDAGADRGPRRRAW